MPVPHAQTQPTEPLNPVETEKPPVLDTASTDDTMRTVTDTVVDAATEVVSLTDDELNTALEAAAFYRDAKLAERSKLQLPAVVLYKGEPFPPEDTLDGQILRAGALVSKLTFEFMKRDLPRLQASNTESQEKDSHVHTDHKKSN